ncbi:MAG: hypothetical protein WC073_02615 [Sterolibacterium sp.]
MEPDSDQKEDALEVPAEAAAEVPAEAPPAVAPTATPAAPPEDPPLAKQRLWPRIKQSMQGTGRLLLRPIHLLRAGLAKIADAGRGLLKRLRKPAAEPAEEEAHTDKRGAERDERPGKGSARAERHKEAAPKEAPAPQPQKGVPSVLLYLMVLLIGVVVGMTFSFALLSTMVFNQAQKIEAQNDEISQLEKQHSILLESEAKYRNENAEYRQRLNKLETLAAAQNAPKETPSHESGENPTVPPSGKSAAPRKTGNCNLEVGNIGNNLSRCVDEFNRK